MNFATIDCSLISDKSDRIAFLSDQSILDYDIIYWKLDKTYELLDGELRRLSGTESNLISCKARIDERFEFRRKQFADFFNNNGLLCLEGVLNYEVSFSKIFNDKVYDLSYHLLALIGLQTKDLPLERLSGKKIKSLDGTVFFNELKNFEDPFKYEYSFKKGFGKPFLVTQKSHHSVGVFLQVGGGRVMIIPSCRFDRNNPFKREFDKFFVASLHKIRESINQLDERVDLPDWLDKLTLSGEGSILLSRNEELEHRERIEARISILNGKIEVFRDLKSILFLDGDLLEKQVRSIFESFGFLLEATEANRDDLILKHNEEVIVCEVKGVKSSAAEKYAAQLEKWASLYFENHGLSPKGLLIVNSYKNTPLEKRTEPTFPNQMLRYSLAREHCLMTTVDLLRLVLSFQSGLITKDDVWNLLVKNVGVLSLDENYTKIID